MRSGGRAFLHATQEKKRSLRVGKDGLSHSMLGAELGQDVSSGVTGLVSEGGLGSGGPWSVPLGKRRVVAGSPDPLPQSDLLRSEREGGVMKGLRTAVVPLSLPPGSESLEDSRDVRNQNGLPGPSS